MQSRRGVDEVARDHALVRRAERDRGFAGQHAGAGADAGAEGLDRGDDVECRTNGALGVVLASDRRAPHGHDRVADELLDRAAVAADHLAGKLEVARQELAGLLRVPALGQRREADEVGEQDRDEAAFRDRGVRGGGSSRGGGRGAVGVADAGRRAALGAELRAGEERRATLPAAGLQRRSALGAEAGVGRRGRAAVRTRHFGRRPSMIPREAASVTAEFDRSDTTFEGAWATGLPERRDELARSRAGYAGAAPSRG